ncbi:MAG: endonuclease/exonuclease/phosphatase family protein [Dysgonamonadaceae bacterium]|nr:endonuclease/exonuclease/phosphatase family protein [Dysgonamonadaceae bacterium]
MKNLLCFFAAALLLVSCKNAPLELTVMTFNLRYDTPYDSLNAWQYRKDAAAQTILNENADIIGTQEVLINQLNDLQNRLPDYAFIGVGREDGKEAGEFSAIFYRKTRFDMLENGTFWLSETPEKPGSMGWDAACERVATWGIFADKASKRRFLAMNTHLDHIGVTAREESLKLIMHRIDSLHRGLPVILTGDLNITPDNPAIKNVTDKSNKLYLIHTKDIAENRSGKSGTFHDYGKIPDAEREFIDYIFVDKSFKVLSHSVIAEQIDGVYSSDHSAVVAKVSSSSSSAGE